MMSRKLKENPSIDFDASQIGQRISAFRKERGFTQQELAEIIGIKQTLISDYETGRIRIFAEMLARFAIALKVSTDDLIGLSENVEGNKQINLRLIKRLQRIEQLPPNKQKTILSSLDMMVDSAENKSE